MDEKTLVLYLYCWSVRMVKHAASQQTLPVSAFRPAFDEEQVELPPPVAPSA